MGKMQVKQDVFENIGLGAGVITTVEPTVNAETNEITINDEDILGATRGGGTFNPNPQVRSRAIDGLAANTVGIHAVDRFEPTLAATFITNTLDILLKGVGFGDIEANEIKARHEVKASDYIEALYFVEALSDGGANIYKLNNAICTAGAAVKTNNEGETEIPLTFGGNYTVVDQDTPPFSIKRIAAPVEPTPTPEPTNNNTPANGTEE